MKKLLTLGTLALVSGALAQTPRISPQSIIVNPTPTELAVKVWTDKDTSGQNVPNYRVGEKIRLYTSVNQDAYVYLFNVNPDGTIDQILPNRYASGGNFLKANAVKQFPAEGDNFTFDVGGPAGLNKVLALASKTQLNLDQISQFKAETQGFATVSVRGQQGFAQALSIIVNPVPANSWTTDVAFYNTVTATAARTGAVTVTANTDATVYINGRQVGAAGSTFANLAPGTYTIRVTAPGFTEYTTSVSVRAGSTVVVPATLQQARVNLSIRSNVEGAAVFINGRQAGVIRNGALSVSLDRDDYEIVVVAPGYRANVTSVQVQNGGTITLNLTRLQ